MLSALKDSSRSSGTRRLRSHEPRLRCCSTPTVVNCPHGNSPLSSTSTPAGSCGKSRLPFCKKSSAGSFFFHASTSAGVALRVDSPTTEVMGMTAKGKSPELPLSTAPLGFSLQASAPTHCQAIRQRRRARAAPIATTRRIFFFLFASMRGTREIVGVVPLSTFE